MIKIAMMGAGSAVFCRGLVRDALSFESLEDAHFALMDVSEERLGWAYNILQNMKEQNSLKCTFSATLDRREALTDADFAISSTRGRVLRPTISASCCTARTHRRLMRSGRETSDGSSESTSRFSHVRPSNATTGQSGAFSSSVGAMVATCTRTRQECRRMWTDNIRPHSALGYRRRPMDPRALITNIGSGPTAGGRSQPICSADPVRAGGLRNRRR